VRRVGMAPALGATGHLDTSNTEAGSGERGSYPAGNFKSALENALSLIAAKLSAARFSYVDAGLPAQLPYAACLSVSLGSSHQRTRMTEAQTGRITSLLAAIALSACATSRAAVSTSA